MASNASEGMERGTRAVVDEARGGVEQAGPSVSSSSLGEGSSSQVEDVRPQAGPLPAKRGEIGYQEREEQEPSVGPSSTDSPVTVLPLRHPADRDAVSPGPGLTSATPFNQDNAVTPTSATPDNASERSTSPSFLKTKHLSTIGGVRVALVIAFIIQVLAMVATVTGWALTVKFMPKASGDGFNSTAVFIHVTFGIATLMELIFLERTVFRLRAERFAFKNPNGNSSSDARGVIPLGFAPWSRPPLPTYAAALAQSGVGTGDVEDNVIAVPPPPAYGHTRGSTLLLSGFVSDNLRAQRSRERVRESGLSRSTSWLSAITTRSERPSRPVSYKSHDSAWDEVMDASRSLELADTLARLEEGTDPSGPGRNSSEAGGRGPSRSN